MIHHINALIARIIRLMSRIPNTAVALLARFSIAAVFWKSGQTKIDGFAVDIISGTYDFGVPRLSDNAVFLFREEYRVPLLPAEVAAILAATAEHVLPVLLLFGLATRLSALGLFVMTLVIQVFVYPHAYATHGTWAAVLLYLMVYGPGKLSVDALISNRGARS